MDIIQIIEYVVAATCPASCHGKRCDLSRLTKASKQLKHHPDDLHWFCPRSGSNSNGHFYDEDLLKGTASENEGAKRRRHEQISEANDRKLSVFEALAIFAFDGKDAEPYQQWLEQNLSTQLRRCDICIREFHRERVAFKERLER